jgi:hypothetical protein
MSLVCYNRPRTNQGHSHVKGKAGTYSKSLELLDMPIASKIRSPMLYPAELRGHFLQNQIVRIISFSLLTFTNPLFGTF